MPPRTSAPGPYSRPWRIRRTAGRACVPPTVDAMAVVSARGLVRTFGEGRAARRVLDGADLDVAAGEIVAVLGRSGSGKSTLLHVLGGLDRPGRGHRRGRRASASRAPASGGCRRCGGATIGFVFQFFHLLPELTRRGATCCSPRACAGRDPEAPRARPRADRPARAARTSPARCRTSSRAASSSASRSRARSSTTRRCCSPTSRPATSTWRPAPACWRSCASSRARAAPSCSSRTRRARRRSPTGCCGSRHGRLVTA